MEPAAPLTRVDVRTVLVVVRLAPGEDARELCGVLDDLRALYSSQARPLPHWSAVRAGRSAVVVGSAVPAELGLPLVWGLPVGAHGEATDAELRAVLESPASARSLLGRWVVVGAGGAGLRVVTSADLAHTLKASEGCGRRAWATRGLAALRACRAPLRLVEDRVPEYVVLDFVLGDDELLAGVRTLPEASVVDLDAAGEPERSYWPAEDRFAPGPATTPDALCALLEDELARIAAVPKLALALTAGKDSRLVAGCLHRVGARPLAFTIGGDDSPDGRGALAVSRQLGWAHLSMLPAGAWRPSWQRVVDLSVWTEGMTTARELAGDELVWTGPPDVVLLSGSGAETGRANYWHDYPPDRDPLALFRGAPPTLGAAARAAWQRRVGEALELARLEAAGDPFRALDLFYARGRMRKWLHRGVPRPETRAILAAFTSPSVTRCLLDLPLDARRSGSAFADALDRLGLPLPVGARPAAGRSRRRWQWPVAEARSASQGVDALLHGRLAEPPAVLELLGARWWHDVRRRAPTDRTARRMLWNALAVQALSERLEGLPVGQGKPATR